MDLAIIFEDSVDSVLFSSFGEEDFQMFVFNKLCSNHRTNINYTCPETICEQYLRLVFSSFAEEDFQRFCIKFVIFKFSLATFSIIM